MNSINEMKRMWNSSLRKANRIAITPIALSQWSKVLRLGPVPRITIEKFFEVLVCLLEIQCFAVIGKRSHKISFFIIPKAAEAGNLEEFVRLYQFDNTRLSVKDGKGRTVAHQVGKKSFFENLLPNKSAIKDRKDKIT